MENNNFKLWKFSCDKNQKLAEELAKGFVELDRGKKKHPLVEAVCKHANEQQEESNNVLVEEENFDDFECNGWINIDDLNVNEQPKPIIESEPITPNINMKIDEDENQVEDTLTESDTNMDTDTNKIENEELIRIANKLKEGKEVFSEKLSELSEIQIINLLKSLSDSEVGIISICSIVSQDLESRAQNLFSSLLCSHILLEKAKERKLQGAILEATSQLVKAVPHILGPQLLVPMLLQEGECSKQASHIVDSCDSALTHIVFRAWLEEKRPQFTDDDFELLKKFLKSPVKDSETVNKSCVLFNQISNTYASNMHFAKLLLSFIKSHHGSVSNEAKENLSLSIANNKTALKKMLEKEIAKI